MSHTVRSKSQRLRFSSKGFFDGDGGELLRVRALRARIQRGALAVRRGGAMPSVEPTGVTIRVDAPAPFIHFPASVDDLRAVLAELPAGSVDGLRGVDLSADAAAPDGPPTPYRYDPIDPLSGRRGYGKVAPNVYGRQEDWNYNARTATVHVYGYAYAPPLPHQELIELALRHRMLAGLVKGVAFHHERHRERARGRRMTHDRARVNARARALADTWIRDVVSPHLARACPEAIARFEAWTLAHGGVVLPLHLLETFDDHTAKLRQVVMGVFETFARLLQHVEEEEDAATSLQDFAFWLHYDGHFDLALAALDRRLAEARDDIEAQALRAHVLVHLYRPREAVDALGPVLAAAPEDLNAWSTLAWAHEELGEEGPAHDARARVDALRRASSSRS